MADNFTNSEQISFNRKVIGLVVGILLNFSVGINDCFWAPFLCQMHEERGINKTTTGLITSGLGFGEIIMSLSLLFLHPPSRKHKQLLCLGPFATGFSLILFGQLNNIFPGKYNTIYSLFTTLSRVIQGLGTALTFCSGAPLLLSFFPDMEGKVISWFSVASPIGQIMGPPIGSILFNLGGYYLPFWVIGLSEIILAIIGFILIPESLAIEKQETEESNIKSVFCKVYLKNVGFILICISAVFVFPAQYFFVGTFSSELLEKFDIQSSEAGFYAFPLILGRVIFSPLFGVLVDNGYSILLFSIFGCLSTSIGYFTLFITNSIKILDNLFMFETSFFILGCTSTAAIVAFIPLNRIIITGNKIDQNLDIASVNSVGAAAAYGCFGLGNMAAFGLFGGVVYDKLGFCWACFTLFWCCFTISVIIALYFLKRKESGQENEIETQPLLNELRN